MYNFLFNVVMVSQDIQDVHLIKLQTIESFPQIEIKFSRNHVDGINQPGRGKNNNFQKRIFSYFCCFLFVHGRHVSASGGGWSGR